MLLCWRVDYLDHDTNQIKSRMFTLDTLALNPVQRAAVELAAESKFDRDILQFRHLFKSDDRIVHEELKYSGPIHCVGPAGYLEDVDGKELVFIGTRCPQTGKLREQIVYADCLPQKRKNKKREPNFLEFDFVNPNAEDLVLFGYFVRDINELANTEFRKHSPASYGSYGFRTTASDEEIRSFVTIFRRIYMAGEPSNFCDTAKRFIELHQQNSLSNYIEGILNQYEELINSHPELPFLAEMQNATFTNKRLFDVFIYTQYAHQPNAQRKRQFHECLEQVEGNQDLLTWAFLTQIWKCSIIIGNAGRIIGSWFKQYCDFHAINPDVLPSLRQQHQGIGTLEKEIDQQARLFEEKVEQLARAIWEEKCQPRGGWSVFVSEARSLLKSAFTTSNEKLEDNHHQ